MKISIPELSLISLIGPSGCGKSTFARKHFKPTQVISSDHCRALVSDDESDQSVSKEAFEIVYFIAEKRLANRKLSVIDATSLQPEARKPLIAMAVQYDVIPVAIVFNLPEDICQERNRRRLDRQVGPEVIERQHQTMLRHLPGIGDEGFQFIYTLSSPEEVELSMIEMQKFSV